MVVIASGSHGTRAVKTDYPNEEGLELGTTKLKDDWILEAEDESLISSRRKVGL